MNYYFELLLKDIKPELVLRTGLSVALTIIFAFVIYQIFIKLLSRLEVFLKESKLKSHKPQQAQRVQVVVGLFRQIGTLCIGSLTVIAVLDALGLDIRPILAGAGVVGLAVGFGSQSLVKDFFGGLCLILENQITIGDWVTINGKSGSVEVLNFRVTVLRDSEGSIHVIPNGSVSTLTNHTHGWSAAVLDLAVPPGLSFDKATDIFSQLGEELRQDDVWRESITGDLIVQGVQDINDKGMVIRVKIETTPGGHWSVGREFRKRLVSHWQQKGLALPRSAQSLYVQNDSPVSAID